MIDRSSNERSVTVYRLTARKICKQSKIKGHLRSRDREPTRIPVKKVMQIMSKINFHKSLKGLLEVINQKRVRVFDRGFQTPRNR